MVAIFIKQNPMTDFLTNLFDIFYPSICKPFKNSCKLLHTYRYSTDSNWTYFGPRKNPYSSKVVKLFFSTEFWKTIQLIGFLPPICIKKRSLQTFLNHPCLEKTFGLTFLPRKDIQCILVGVIYGMIWDHFWIFWFTPFQVNWGQRRPRG